MLNKKEKKEMLEDGRNPRRRKDFTYGQRLGASDSRSLDVYIKFLMSAQRALGESPVSRDITMAKFNKL